MSSLRHALSLSLLTSLNLFGAAAFAQATPTAKLPPMPKWQETDLVKTSSEIAAVAPVATAATEADVTAPKAKAEAPKPESKTFTSDGAPVALADLGFAITPPAGWEVNTYAGTLSLVMREPKDDAPSYDKPKYQRNITMAVRG